MKISPINLNSKSFKGIVSPNQFVPKKIFGEKEDVIRTLSDAKKLDIWTFGQSTGGFVNPKVHYDVIIRDAKSNNVKTFAADEKGDTVEKMASKIEETLVLYDAPSNLSVIDEVAKSPAAEKNPEYAKEITERLFTAGISSETALWQTKIKML